MLGTFGGALEARNIDASGGRMTGTVRGEVETDDLSEVDVVNVQPGANANITVDALPGVTLKGQVTSIVPRSITKRGDVTYTVKVAISNPDPKLKWGMTSFVDIVKGK
jgi:hypothetical protein